MKQNENGKKIKENIRNQMRRIGSWKSWSKRRKLTTGVCGVCVIAVVAGAIGLSGSSDTEVIYKETTVKYGTLVKGVTETGSVDIGTVDQTFDLDMSALQRTDTSGSSSSGSADSTGVFHDFKGKDLDGNDVDDSLFAQNKVTVVNFWFSGCKPCVEELSKLNELNDKIKKMGGNFFFKFCNFFFNASNRFNVFTQSSIFFFGERIFV